MPLTGLIGSVEEDERREEIRKLMAETVCMDPKDFQPGLYFFLPKNSEKARNVGVLNIDSLDTAEILMKLEDEYKINIPKEYTDIDRTVRDIEDYVLKNSPKFKRGA
ncbi:hypothetical protein HYV50_06060 [Candidatus Pacearchaeota archaeon]|nr:hypothetical protein [Candidatus Pacearchaeota archaeon]